MPTGRFAKEMTGQRFARWVVLSKFPGHQKNGHATYLCRCDCGAEKTVTGARLRNGQSQSCGCLAREASSERMIQHGQTKHRLFPTWVGMMQRCYNPKNAAYERYGGRGVTVCQRWHDVAAFIEDNEHLAAKGLSIDRVNNDGPYSPENCRWAPRTVQSRNRRSNVMLTYSGKTQPLFDWAIEMGIPPRTLWARIRARGWEIERALTTPVR